MSAETLKEGSHLVEGRKPLAIGSHVDVRIIYSAAYRREVYGVYNKDFDIIEMEHTVFADAYSAWENVDAATRTVMFNLTVEEAESEDSEIIIK